VLQGVGRGRACCLPITLAPVSQLAARDFKEQEGLLQEELESRGQKMIFYPKFHRELSPTDPLLV
jgi:hypothetical protein